MYLTLLDSLMYSRLFFLFVPLLTSVFNVYIYRSSSCRKMLQSKGLSMDPSGVPTSKCWWRTPNSSMYPAFRPDHMRVISFGYVQSLSMISMSFL